jgi:hypothetical protein
MDNLTLADAFRDALVNYRKGGAPLTVDSDGRYSLEYVPFEHVNIEAKLYRTMKSFAGSRSLRPSAGQSCVPILNA